MHEAVQRIHESAHILREEHSKSDELGRLTDKAAQVLRESGGMRLLQAKESGGYESDPKDFFEWVRAVAQYNPSAGWIAGVVGVHPWQMALLDPRVQAEIYGEHGEKADTWVASPYQPNGRMRPVEGGFTFSTEVPYSTGTDHCDWVILAGIVTDDEGNLQMVPGTKVPDIRHVMLPRGEYEIVEGSWNVMGLTGTGSKNVRVTDAFVPEYRTVELTKMNDGSYTYRQPGKPLYQLSFGCTFSAAIVSGTFGIARGALDAYRDYLKTRVSAAGVVGATDPYQQQALAEAEADLEAGIMHVDVMTDRMMAQVSGGEPLTQMQRLEFRRNQVRAAQRVIASVDKVYSLAGSSAVWTTRPLESYWRDLRTASSHICNVMDTAYSSWANAEFQTGGPVITLH